MIIYIDESFKLLVKYYFFFLFCSIVIDLMLCVLLYINIFLLVLIKFYDELNFRIISFKCFLKKDLEIVCIFFIDM